jgi:hypothetical protein
MKPTGLLRREVMTTRLMIRDIVQYPQGDMSTKREEACLIATLSNTNPTRIDTH